VTWAILFFVVKYVVTGLLWLPVIRSGQPLATVMQGPAGLAILVATITPTLVAIALSGVEHGWRGIGDLLRQGTRWRFGIGWYALAVLLIPLVWAVALVTGLLVGAGAPEVHLDFLIPIAAIGEEFGWRGYALPRVQPRIGPLPASLLIGVVWAAWHLPYFAFPEIHPLPLLIDFSLFAIVIVSESVLATWIYNSTSQSVLATTVFHHSIHLASVIPVIPGVVGTLIFALVHAAAAAAAVLVSGASLIGTGRVRIGGPSVKPASA
jgi:membrane protease YdiL (CAAX protease family)